MEYLISLENVVFEEKSVLFLAQVIKNESFSFLASTNFETFVFQNCLRKQLGGNFVFLLKRKLELNYREVHWNLSRLEYFKNFSSSDLRREIEDALHLFTDSVIKNKTLETIMSYKHLIHSKTFHPFIVENMKIVKKNLNFINFESEVFNAINSYS